MKQPSYQPLCRIALGALLAASTLAPNVRAEGTEMLGTPSIAIAAGTDTILAGVGLIDSQPGNIQFEVPAGATVQQALLYWEGTEQTAAGQGDSDDITVNAGAGDLVVSGTRIGGPTLFFQNTTIGDGWTSTYRADVTSLVHGGANSIAVSGLDFDTLSNGAGILVIIDDGLNTASVQVKDGNDAAFINFAGSLATTAPVTFDYAPADFERIGDLSIFVSSVALENPGGGFGRPTIIDIQVFQGALLLEQLQLADRLANSDGAEWDSYSTSNDPQATLLLPAGSNRVVVSVLSQDAMNGNAFEGHLPASLVWLASSLSVPGIPDEAGACRVTGGVNGVYAERVYHGSGQAGAPTANQPQPYGEWTHHQRRGPDGRFVFHAGTASAPAGTSIVYIECSDPGYCSPARPAPAKQIDFVGRGTFKNLHDASPEFAAVVIPDVSLHWFSVHIEDLGEPGGQTQNSDQCPEQGSAGQVAPCDCPDFYRMRIHVNESPDSAVLYEVYSYAVTGNYQIHPQIGG